MTDWCSRYVEEAVGTALTRMAIIGIVVSVLSFAFGVWQGYERAQRDAQAATKETSQ